MKRQVYRAKNPDGASGNFWDGSRAGKEFFWRRLSAGNFLFRDTEKSGFSNKKESFDRKDSLRPKQSAYLSGGRPAYSLAKSEKLSMM